MDTWALWAGFSLLWASLVQHNKQLAAAASIAAFFYIVGFYMESVFAGETWYFFFIAWDLFFAASLWIWARGPVFAIVICVLNALVLGYLPLWLHWHTETGFYTWKLYFPFWYLPLQISLICSVVWSIHANANGPPGGRWRHTVHLPVIF